jgi:hypothetical protein
MKKSEKIKRGIYAIVTIGHFICGSEHVKCRDAATNYSMAKRFFHFMEFEFTRYINT